MNPELEQCLLEIQKAEAAVRASCDFGAYIWLQDWREEMVLILDNATREFCHTNCLHSGSTEQFRPHLFNTLRG